jgi:hypothetical protein
MRMFIMANCGRIRIITTNRISKIGEGRRIQR